MLYQEIMNVPGLSGGTWDRQKALYEKLGAPQGAYTGSYNQNIWLLNQIHAGNTGGSAAPAAPVETPEQAIARQQREANEAAAAETKKQSDKWKAAIADLQGYIGKYNYDDVAAGQDGQYNSFLDAAAQGNEYQWQDPEKDGVAGIGPEYLNMLKIAAQKYMPEYQRKNLEHSQDQFNQGTETQNQYEGQMDSVYGQYGSNGISGGLANAAEEKARQTQGNILRGQQQTEQRFQGDQKQQRIEDVLGLAKSYRNQYINQYRDEMPAKNNLEYGGNYTALQNQYNNVKY